MWTWFHRLASPPTFYRFADRLAPWLLVAGSLLIGVAVWQGLFVAPADYQQGDAFRIIYVHVPAAALSLSIYTAMSVAGAQASPRSVGMDRLGHRSTAPAGRVQAERAKMRLRQPSEAFRTTAPAPR